MLEAVVGRRRGDGPALRDRNLILQRPRRPRARNVRGPSTHRPSSGCWRRWSTRRDRPGRGPPTGRRRSSWASDEAGLDGRRPARQHGLHHGRSAGRATADFVPTSSSEALRAALPTTFRQTVLREYFPIRIGDRSQAVVGCLARRRADPGGGSTSVRRRRDRRDPDGRRSWRRSCCSSSSGRPRAGSTARPTQLVEATRRDPLTGTPNHGALVERARRGDRGGARRRASRSRSRCSTSTTSGCSTTPTATPPATRRS